MPCSLFYLQLNSTSPSFKTPVYLQALQLIHFVPCKDLGQCPALNFLWWAQYQALVSGGSCSDKGFLCRCPQSMTSETLLQTALRLAFADPDNITSSQIFALSCTTFPVIVSLLLSHSFSFPPLELLGVHEFWLQFGRNRRQGRSQLATHKQLGKTIPIARWCCAAGL